MRKRLDILSEFSNKINSDNASQNALRSLLSARAKLRIFATNALIYKNQKKIETKLSRSIITSIGGTNRICFETFLSDVNLFCAKF
jgi:ribosomal protein L4